MQCLLANKKQQEKFKYRYVREPQICQAPPSPSVFLPSDTSLKSEEILGTDAALRAAQLREIIVAIYIYTKKKYEGMSTTEAQLLSTRTADVLATGIVRGHWGIAMQEVKYKFLEIQSEVLNVC